MWKEEEGKVVAAEVKVGAKDKGSGKYDRGRLPSCGRVKYLSDGQFSGRARGGEREGRSRERREMRIGCSAKERERKRTVCSLDRIIAGGSVGSPRLESPRPHLTSNFYPSPGSSFLASLFCVFILLLLRDWALPLSLSISHCISSNT